VISCLAHSEAETPSYSGMIKQWDVKEESVWLIWCLLRRREGKRMPQAFESQ
jgi:hypothetical protein